MLYELDVNVDHVGPDGRFDAHLVVTSELAGRTLVELSQAELERVVVRSTSKKIEWTDWVWIDQGWPIVSQALLDALRSVGDFPHAFAPVTIRAANGGHADVDTQYFVFQVPLSEGLFDWDRSDCVRDDLFPEIVESLESVVLVDEDAAPPIFRLLEWSVLLVKEDVATMLAESGLRGFDLSSVGPEAAVVIECP